MILRRQRIGPHVESGCPFYGALAAITLSLMVMGCSSPKLDLSSDEAYRDSLVELRASLESDEEREILAAIVQELRAWRTSGHQELMDVPSPTPAQKERLHELELAHEVRLRELLHGKDVDGIAQAYKQKTIINLKETIEAMNQRKESLLQAQQISVVVVDLPEFKRPGGFGRPMRVVEFVVRNGSHRTISGDSYTSVQCRCASEECTAQQDAEFSVLHFEHSLPPGDQVRMDTLDLKDDEQPTRLASITEPSDLRCWLTEVELEAESALGEPESVWMYGSSPEERLSEVEEGILSSERRYKELQSMPFDFETLIAEITKERAQLSSGDAPPEEPSKE